MPARRAESVGLAIVVAIAITLALPLFPASAAAQFSAMVDPGPQFEWTGQLQTDFLAEFETDTDGGDEFEAWHVGLGGEMGGPINESMLVGLEARYRHAEYRFHLDNGPFPNTDFSTNELPKDPWGGLDTIDLAPTTTILVGDRVQVRAGVPMRWSAEVGARRNAFTAGVSALASWQINEHFRAGLGIGVTSQLEGKAETFPIIALDWQVSGALRVTTEGSWVQGGRLGVFWGPGEVILLSATAAYERNRFRLDDNGTTADTDGIGEITSVPIELGFRLRLTDRAQLDVRGGFAFAGRFRVENRRGEKLYDQNFDPAPRVSVSLTIPLGPYGPTRANQEPGFDPDRDRTPYPPAPVAPRTDRPREEELRF